MEIFVLLAPILIFAICYLFRTLLRLVFVDLLQIPYDLSVSFSDEGATEEKAQDAIYVASTIADMDDGIDAEQP